MILMFHILSLAKEQRSLCCLRKSVERLNSCCCGYFYENSQAAPSNGIFENFVAFVFVLLNELESMGSLIVEIG
jgi:hypothetical protein